MMRRLILVMVLLASFQYVLAEPVSPSGLAVISSTTRSVSGISNVSAQGGNVTQVNIDALTVTRTWQGYFGNVTGNIHLDDASNNSFYIWGNATSLSGEVFASRNSSPQWSSINCTNGSQRSREETYLGVAATDGDSVTNTFNRTTHPSFNVGLRPILQNSCLSTNAFVNGANQTTRFYQVLLSDVNNQTIYTTLLENDQTAYNGQTADFQLLVGENEHDGSSGSTSYYFFVEIS
jgi:hypothetical protein